MIEVIGWTNYDDDFEEAENTKEEYEALIKNIRDNGYRFSGNEHEYLDSCTPVLSNGKIMHFSWRGWGKVMADAYNYNGKYDYSLWYMSDVAPLKPIYPKKYIDFSKIAKGKTIDIFLTIDEENILKSMWDNYETTCYIYTYDKYESIYKNDSFVIHLNDGTIIYPDPTSSIHLSCLEFLDQETIDKSQYKGTDEKELYDKFMEDEDIIGFIKVDISNFK